LCNLQWTYRWAGVDGFAGVVGTVHRSPHAPLDTESQRLTVSMNYYILATGLSGNLSKPLLYLDNSR
jgi:hypothetical protein